MVTETTKPPIHEHCYVWCALTETHGFGTCRSRENLLSAIYEREIGRLKVLLLNNCICPQCGALGIDEMGHDCE